LTLFIMKNKLTDIDEILAKSQRLTSLAGLNGSSPASNRHVSRGVAELTEFSKQWTKDPSIGQNNLDAFRLLSQKNFDAKKLFEDVSNIQVKTSDDSAVRLEGTDIEGYLAHQHDMIILTAIEEAKQGAEDHVQEMQRRWAAAEWSQARHKFMESLGHRAYRWEGQASAPTPAKDFTTSAVQAARSSSTPFTPHRDAFAKRADIFSPLSPSAIPSSRRSLYGNTVASLDTRPPFSDLIALQSAAIRRLNRSSHTGGSSPAAVVGLNEEPAPAPGSVKPFLQLGSGVRVPEQGMGRAIVSDNLSKADLLAYKAHLQLLASTVGESNVQRGSATAERDLLVGHTATRQVPALFTSIPGETGAPPAGYFSGLCLDPTDFAASAASSQFAAMEERRQWLTVGSKSFLEVQYWDVMTHSLDEAVSREGWQLLSSADGTSRQQKLRSYVAYLHHSRQLPAQCAQVLASTGMSGPTEMRSPTTPAMRGARTAGGSMTAPGQPVIPLWVFVYHCFRVGDLASAVSELSSAVSKGHVEGGLAAISVLQTLVQLVASPSPSSRGAAGAARSKATLAEHEVRALVEAILQCRVQYERETGADEVTLDPYRLVVFNLLGLASKEDLAGNVLPGFSLEDFLWTHLWFIQYTRILQPVLTGTNLPTPLAANERMLFEMMLEYGGPDYFDEDRTNPFRYAMVLICCQRFGDAIAHLWQCNKIVPAVHLTCAALHYGLILPHVPLDMNPAHPMVMGSRFVHGSAYATTQDPTPASILQFFTSTPVVQAHPAVAVDYLIALDSNWLTHAQGLEAELKESLKLKSQAVVSAVLESFIASLTREQLNEVVGEPTDGKIDVHVQTMRGNMRTHGRLDDYLSPAQVELLLARTAYHMLTQRKEAEAAVYLYLLAGRYSELVEELCTQLSGVLVPHSGRRGAQSHNAEARTQWHTLAENFIERYLQPAANGEPQSAVLYALTQSGGRGLIDALLLLTNTFKFVDAVCQGEVKPMQALHTLDNLLVLPVAPEQVATCAEFSPFLRPVMDDLLIMAMECTTNARQQLQVERVEQQATTSGASNFAGLHTDKDIQISALKQRAVALAAFAQKIRGKLVRQDTVGILTRMEASIA